MTSRDVSGNDRASNDMPGSRRWRVFVFLLLTVLLSQLPLVCGNAALAKEGVATNSFTLFVALPLLSQILVIIGLVTVRMLMKGVLCPDVLLTKNIRSDALGTLLLIAAVTASHLIVGVVARRLGFLARDGAFTTSLTVPNAFLMIYTLRVVAVTPFVEEVFWRVYFQGTLQRLSNGCVALMVQTILFALVHMRGLFGTLDVFLLGLICGAWRWRKGTFVPLVVTHMVLNGLACIGMWRDELEMRRIRTAQDYRVPLEAMCVPRHSVWKENALHCYERASGLFVQRPSDLSEADIRMWPGHLSSEKATSLRTWIVSNEEAIARFKVGAQKAYYCRAYSKEPMELVRHPILSDFRAMVLVTLARAQVHAIDGEFNQSLADILLCYRVGQHLGGPKPVLEQLMGIGIYQQTTEVAFRIIAYNRDNPSHLRELQFEIGTLLRDNGIVIDFSGEQLLCYALIQESFTDDGDGAGHIPQASIRRVMSSRAHARVTGSSRHADTLRWEALERRETRRCVDTLFAYLACVEKSTPFELPDNGLSLQGAMEQAAQHNVLLEELIPGYAKAYRKAFCQRALSDSVVVVAAIMRYRVEQGVFPDELNTLLHAKYLESLPTDPFTGLPFFYRNMGQDFMLYSAGPDSDDDGGIRGGAVMTDFNGDDVFWPRAVD